MLKLNTKSTDITEVILMSEMSPYEVGQIVEENSSYYFHYVMRTAATRHFEVINLTAAKKDSCWGIDCNLKVRLLGPDEKLHIELYNE